jgi:hypothetical protein
MDSRQHFWTAAMFGLLACTASIPLIAPLFPTQDGPVHLYYADVLRGVLLHSAPYAQHFEIKSLLTPYALQYYSLFALETVFSPAVSEKVLVVCYIVAFGLSFRYLVESVARPGSPWILAGLPFCMHTLVYMGFLNYSFAVTLLMFLCGAWIRFSGSLTSGRVAALLGGLILMLVTHPVPVAVFLLFIVVYFVCDAAGEPCSWKESLRVRWRPLALIAAMAAMALLWIGRFVSGQVDPIDQNHVTTWGWFNAFATELQLYPVAPFSTLFYRAGSILSMAFACLAAIAGFRRGKGAPAIALLGTSGICFLLYCIVPERVNGGYYFAERFPILWILFLMAGASALRMPRAWNIGAGVIAVAVTAGVLSMQWSRVAEIGLRIAREQDSPAAAAGSIGLIVGPRRGMPDGLAFNPYLWSGAHYFRRSKAILANEPWMEGPMMMLRPAHPNRWSYRDPDAARQELETATVEGAAEDQSPDFVVQGGLVDGELDSIMKRWGWTDSGPANEYIRIYRRR